MKKIFKGLIIILIIPLFFLVSCGQGESSNSNSTPPISSSTPPISSSTPLKEFDNVYMNNLIVIYNGNTHSLKVRGEYPSNAKITYQNNDQVDAGIYEVKATITCDGYNTKTLTANLTIEQAEYDIGGVQFLNKTVIYDGNEHSLEIIGTLPEGLEVAYETNKLTNAGKVKAKAHFISNNPNYKDLPTLEATLTVLKNKVEITKDNFPDAEYEYDRKEKKITLNIALPKGIKATYFNNTLTEPGIIEATVKLEIKELNNYEPLKITEIKATLKINPPAGLIIEENTDGTMTVKKYEGDANILYIPYTINGKEVTTIDDFSFESCSTLNRIMLPDSVIHIGNGAFFNCTNLNEINISSNVECIGNKAFYNCTLLVQVDISHGLKTIGESVFYKCSKLKTIEIPDSVISIGSKTFYECESLTNIKLSQNLKSISDKLFYRCHYLKDIEIPNGVSSIGESAFEGCHNLGNVFLPDTMISIGKYAFKYADVRNINLPDSINYIGSYAFCESSVSTIKIPKELKIIESYTFSECDSLVNVIFHDGIEKINNCAFDHTRLTSITIPNSVTYIGSCPFWGCNLLKVYLPNSIKYMGKEVFYECSSLAYIYLEEGTDTSEWDFRWKDGCDAEIITGYKPN